MDGGRNQAGDRSRAGGHVALCLALTLAAACGRISGRGAPASATPPAPPAGIEVIQGQAATPPLPISTDDRLVGLPGGDVPLGATAGRTLIGGLAPIAVPSSDGRAIAYNAWRWLVPFEPEKSWSQLGVGPDDPIGIPSIRLVDLTTGKDTLLADGAFSVAWRADGALAYVQGKEPEVRAAGPYLGQIVVRSSLNTPAEVWTAEPDRYTLYGWAGDRLLAVRPVHDEPDEVLSLEGPSSLHRIGSGAIVAVSPDGASVVIAGFGPDAEARLIDVASGAELGAVSLSHLAHPRTGQAAVGLGAGAWSGERLVAPAAYPDGSYGLATLTVSDATLGVSDLAMLPSAVLPWGTEGVRLTTEGHVLLWGPIPGNGGEARDRVYVYLECDLGRARCVQGPPVADLIFDPVYNPSRPWPEDYYWKAASR